MKSLKLVGLALGAPFVLSIAVFAEDITIAVAAPFQPADEERLRDSSGADQPVRQRAWQEARAGRRERCPRPKQARLGGRKGRWRQDPFCRPASLLFVVDPAVRSLQRGHRAAPASSHPLITSRKVPSMARVCRRDGRQRPLGNCRTAGR